jgi:hypothetical protein
LGGQGTGPNPSYLILLDRADDLKSNIQVSVSAHAEKKRQAAGAKNQASFFLVVKCIFRAPADRWARSS